MVLIDCRRLPILKTAHDRRDHNPQNMFCSSAPSSENQDRTTVPRACSTVLPPLQRSYNTAVVLHGGFFVREVTTQQWSYTEDFLKTPTFIQTTFWNRTMFERSRREEERKKERDQCLGFLTCAQVPMQLIAHVGYGHRERVCAER